LKYGSEDLITFSYNFSLIDYDIDKSWCVKVMAFAVHVNMERCTGCGNCVVACPVDALELFTIDPVTNEKIYGIEDGKSVVLDFKAELCAGCGVCVEACPYDVIRLASYSATVKTAEV